MAHRNNALAKPQDEIPTVRPPQSGWHQKTSHASQELRRPANDGLWQLVRDVMQAEADEALWGTRR